MQCLLTFINHYALIPLLFDLECGTSDVQMGFCMATSGMTQGGQGDEQMEEPSRDPDLQDTAESMDADEDAEVHQ